MKEQALAPKYDHKAVEAGRYQEWLDEDVFKPSGDQKPSHTRLSSRRQM